jgi:hypothetical protein
MGTACGTHARGKKHIQGSCLNHEVKNFLQDFDADTRMILKKEHKEIV